MASLAFHVAINSMISLWVYSLLPLLLFLFDSQLLPKEHEDVEVFTTDTVLLTVTCSWFCTILLDFSSMFLCEIHFTTFFFFKRMPTFFSSKRKQTLMGESANGRCSVRKVFFFATSLCSGHWLTCSARKSYSHRRRLFSQIILPEIRTEGIRSPRNLAVLLPKKNSELVLFAGY